jgi:hypothetical protein
MSCVIMRDAKGESEYGTRTKKRSRVLRSIRRLDQVIHAKTTQLYPTPMVFSVRSRALVRARAQCSSCWKRIENNTNRPV